MLKLKIDRQTTSKNRFEPETIAQSTQMRKCSQTLNEKMGQSPDQGLALAPLARADLVRLFSQSGASLSKNVEGVTAGRTSLVLQGIRQFTFYVDLIFFSEDDISTYIESLKSIGYKLQAFGKWLRFVKSAQIDLWLNRTHLISDSMMKRTKRLEENTGRLTVRLLLPQDIMIVDSLSSHAGDLDDIRTIIEKTTVDWELVLSELRERMADGVSRRVPIALSYALEKLQAKGVRIPEKFSDDLLQILSQQDLRKN